MIIRYSDGSWVEGLLHRLERGTLRATVVGIDDAVEYTLFEYGWISDRAERNGRHDGSGRARVCRRRQLYTAADTRYRSSTG
jgi:hypothetical protein